MVGRPGRLQAAFNSLELDPLLHERTGLKPYSTGLARAENIEASPQGGFRNRDGLRDIGSVPADAARLFNFEASTGVVYDVVARDGAVDIWGETSLLDTVSIAGLTAAMLPEITTAQLDDTMLLFHEDLETKRLKHAGPTDWSVDNAPWTGVPNWDYGADINGDPYTNGVAAVWEIEFVGLTDADSVFVLTVSGQDTVAILYDSTTADLVNLIEPAILDLPNVSPGAVAVTSVADKVNIVFSGAGNEGDGWAVSGRVINKTDAAIISRKTVVGVAPGEPLWSADRGWPQCGCFTNGQRLAIGGFKGLRRAWAFSRLADYFNYDERFTGADGPALVPMNAAAGERIERIVDNLNLLIFTSKAEYWLESRTLAATEAPNHVKASTHGTPRGVPIVESEGAALFSHRSGGVLSELRYTDVEGNFAALDFSLYAAHLVTGVRDMAVRRSTVSSDGHQLMLVQADGSAVSGVLLREYEVTGFGRMTSGAGLFKAVSVNGRNEVSWLIQRPSGRRLERQEDGLLLDEAVSGTNSPASVTVNCGSRFNGRSGIWVIADGSVFGPFTVSGGAITLPVAVETWTVGSWAAPVAQSLPQSRDIGPNTVLKRKARIHSLKISVIDTTSLAVSVNGKALQDVDLLRFGMVADVPELDQGVTGEITIRGLTGFADEPYWTISQVRPGRLTVRSVTAEAQL